MENYQFVDISGTLLTPSFMGSKCLGNGENFEYECCCDECGYFLYCFPQYNYLFMSRKKKRKALKKPFKIRFMRAKIIQWTTKLNGEITNYFDTDSDSIN